MLMLTLAGLKPIFNLCSIEGLAVYFQSEFVCFELCKLEVT